MPITDEGSLGTNNVSAAGSTITLDVSEAVPAGNLLVVWVAWDNNNGTTATTVNDPQLRCDDEKENDYRTLASGQNTGGAQNAGAHVALFAAVLDVGLEAGDTITVTQTITATLVAKVISARHFSGWGKTNCLIPLNGAVSVDTDAGDPGAATLASMTSAEYLLLHAIATEGPSSDTFTQDSDYTSIDSATAANGGGASDMTIRGGFRVATVTGDTCDVSINNSRDHMQVLVAIRPSDAPYVRWAQGGPANAVVTTLTSATANAPSVAYGGSVAWHRKGDVVVFVQVGQQVVNIPNIPSATVQTDSAQIAGSQRLTVGDITMTVVWMRMRDNDENSFVGQDVSQANLGVLFILGGCCPHGTPFELLGELTEAGADTSVEWNGDATTFAEELILLLAANGRDSTAASYSAFTNANLTEIQEVADVGSTLLNGLGVGGAIGYKATPGSVGTSTATLAASDVDITMTLGFKPKNAPFPKTPYVRRVLACGESAGALSLAWSASDLRPGDLIVVFANAESTQDITLSGYTEFPDSPQDVSGVRLEAFYKLADGTETGLTFNDPGDHCIAVALAVAEAEIDGVPYDVTAGGTEGSDTTLSATGDTTTAQNTLILVAAAHSTDTANSQFYDAANADINDDYAPGQTRVEQVTELTGALGVGGGVAVWAGTKATPGAFGATTATLMTASEKAFISIALKPRYVPRPVVTPISYYV